MFVRSLAALLVFLSISAVARAQPTTATVVPTCGTPGSIYSPGAVKSVTQDTTGTLCTAGGGGGGGGSVTQGTTPWIDQLVAGSAIIGKVGIDQTTPGTTNGVVIAPTSASGAGIVPVASASAESSHVLKASAGNVYTVSATNLTATAGFLVLINATSAPADGAITPPACAPLPANGSASISYGVVPGYFGTGIVAVVTSAATCFTKTTGTLTALLSGTVQ